MKEGFKKTRNATGAAIRRFRISKGWSQKVLARELNLGGLHYVDTTLIGKIEAGIRRCYDYEVFLIAETLDLEMHQLFPAISDVIMIAELEHEKE